MNVQIVEDRAVQYNSYRRRQQDILQGIIEERDRQDNKWGLQKHDLGVWMLILTEEVGEASEAALRTIFGNPDNISDFEEEVLQVAEVAVKILEFVRRARETNDVT